MKAILFFLGVFISIFAGAQETTPDQCTFGRIVNGKFQTEIPRAMNFLYTCKDVSIDKDRDATQTQVCIGNVVCPNAPIKGNPEARELKQTLATCNVVYLEGIPNCQSAKECLEDPDPRLMALQAIETGWVERKLNSDKTKPEAVR